jgi:hypothetical protein
MDEKLNLLVIENKKEKYESYQFKKRKFEDWNANYALYRDRVKTNRLTQRQSINVPIMRDTIQNWISKIDEPPELFFETRGYGAKDKTGELILNELWKHYFDKLDLDILDNLDKKVVGIQGRSFKIIGMSKNEIFIDDIDPYDIEISPKFNVLDLNSAQYVIRTNIFKTVKEIEANAKYLQSGKNELKQYLDTKDGIVKKAGMNEAYLKKQERLQDLGSPSTDQYSGSDTVVELNEAYKLIWHPEEKRFVRHLIIIAADAAVLYDKPLKDAIGIDRLPIVSWASDPDLNDVWSDSIGDNVRTFNKVSNMYISQDLENRTYRTFGMSFYNTMNGTFQPKGFDPKPFGMYGVPGNPSELIQQMRIEPLNDTAQQITFLKELIQSSVAQTATERGEQTKSRTTLGEVQLNLQQSQGRNLVVAKQYRNAWKEIGQLFYDLLNANAKGTMTLYKKGSNGRYYAKDISPDMWKNPKGYECRVVMKAEKESADNYGLQSYQYVMQNFANNPVAVQIAKEKQLEILGWPTEQIEQVMQAEKQMMGMSTGQEEPEDDTMDPSVEQPNQPLSNDAILKQQ